MTEYPLSRRRFVARSLMLAAPAAGFAQTPVARQPGVKLKLALNAYSFDKPLRAGSMTLEDVIHFCAQQRVDALDATGYYFPGYPKAPPDEYIYNLKRLAFLNGVQLSGTGVRNDFAVDDAAARKSDLQMVKDWIEVAGKLGAPVIRVFSGRIRPEGKTFEQVLQWMIPAFQECAEYGARHGVIIGLQQHNDFLKTADETIRVIQAVKSRWFGDILDVGSLRQGDPYAEIEKLLPYAISWQLKENVGYGAREVPTDLKRVKAIIDKVGYRGVLPFEALGPGDPRAKVTSFLAQIRDVFAL
ncbi:MAG TPA: sugar phosphate isomerase/epimerase family protein [Bryobacteraceae bacterium]|nr:sugar phosphate isomerase/epimerase family protein [Bryobacteraceae bacterium]